MIKVKYSALIELECEASEQTPGVMTFEKIAKRFDGGRFMDDAVRRFICVYARPIKKLKYQHSCQYRNGPNCNLN